MTEGTFDSSTPPGEHCQSPADPGLLAVTAALAASGLRGQITCELRGGASTRRFFRVRLDSDDSLVGMYMPEPSQEIQKARQSVGGLAFVEIQRLLRERQVDVPDIIAHHPEHHVLLVEDLGEATLAEYLTQHQDCTRALYHLAIRDLARAQLALRHLPDRCLVQQRAFDASLLRWEVDHFRDWALDARGIRLSPGQGEAFDQAAGALSKQIGELPRGFVHRDYQSRNLMVRETPNGHRLTWIDFQDAMLGPRAYDLVALLMDSYQTFDRTFVLERLEEYGTLAGTTGQQAELLFEFDLITVQRKLKDAGRFIFIARTNGNESFLRYVDSTIFRARSALRRVASHTPELTRLDSLLTDVLGDLCSSEPALDPRTA